MGRQLGAEHSQRLESYFQSIPGVQLVACSTVANAKALLKSAIRSDNPIIFFEHVLLYNVKGADPSVICAWCFSSRINMGKSILVLRMLSSGKLLYPLSLQPVLFPVVHDFIA